MFHRYASLAVLLAFFAPTLQAQEDTLRVHTLTFDSITTRRGWWVFPDDSHTYRKVLMHHTLKCSPLTTQDQYPCGEWDYLTYSFVHDHTGVLDSLALEHPYFLVGTAAPPMVVRTDAPLFDTWQEEVDVRTNTATISENAYLTGTGDASVTDLFPTAPGPVRAQYLFTAAELVTAGLQAGPIAQLRLPIELSGSGTIDRLTVRMKSTTATALATFDNAGLQTVYDQLPQGLGGTTEHYALVLAEPFDWDGTSNVLIDLASVRGTAGSAPGLTATAMADHGVLEAGDDGYISVMNDHVAVDPTLMGTISDQITITFRLKGDAATLPANTTILEAYGTGGQRILNIHLPWSDNSVYWDAGNDEGYDRINRVATTNEMEGQWNHWAFTKNTNTGSMKIYLNGVQWHSGTAKTKVMDGIVKFRIASGGNGDVPYPGLIDEFNVFGTELNQATINAWKDRKVDATHPQAASLLYSLHFDEPVTSFRADNSADAAHPAWNMGTVQRLYRKPTELFAAPVVQSARPDIVFAQGEYTSELNSEIISTQVAHPGLAQEFFEVQGNYAVSVDTTFGWSAATTYTYDPDGNPTTPIVVEGTEELNDTLEYFGVPFEVVNDYEIGRFITPYGIGLNLGTNGFRWTYDVTDYQWLLHDSVEISSGNQQELIDLTFELIEGTPPREVVNFQRPWGAQRGHSYADLTDDTSLPPVEVDLHPDAEQWTLRTRLTGHGHNSNTGNYPHCCEWKDNSHYMDVNGQQVDEWHIWQTNDCALNPVYPQGGTWLGSREGWCPGDVVKDHDVNLTPHVSGTSATLDYSITPVPSNNLGMGGGVYVVNMDLFEFGAPAHQLDAEIVEVKRPSTADYRRRDNPICYDPVITLRNAGAADLTSVTFTIGVSGGTMLNHTWTGLLKHMEQTDVIVPISGGAFWAGDDEHQFTATVSAPNGGTDQHAANDSYRTTFELPVVYAENFILHYRTNNRPEENTVTIRDINGNVVFNRSVHTANTEYRDTLELWDGCYTLEVLDEGNDGLAYWADPAAGDGLFRFLRLSGTVLKTFQDEFGRKIHWPFTIGAMVGIPETEANITFHAFPNPSAGRFTLNVDGMQGDAILVVFDAAGHSVEDRTVQLYGQDRLELDLEQQPDGLYLVRLTSDASSSTLLLMKQ